MDKTAFFAALRRDLFPAGLTKTQVERIEMLADAIDRVAWPLPYAAYAQATAHHETAQWTHLKEIGGDAYFKRMYDKAGSRPKVAAALGNTEPGDGVKYAGRGYVQLTGRTNYRKAGAAIGLDLLKEPDLACEPATAARILVWGMATGAYTGKANRDYLNKEPPDYVNARRIINGTDKASLIAGYARQFESALKVAGYGDAPKAVPTPKPLPASPQDPPPAVIASDVPLKPTLRQRLAALFGR